MTLYGIFRMKRALFILLATSLSGLSHAGEGRILTNGPIAIQLNEEPALLIKAAPKEAEIDKNSVGGGDPGKAVLSDEQVDFLANKFAVARKLEYRTATALKKKNPNFRYNTYTASTYLKKWPLEEVERDYMMHVAMCPAAVLRQDLNESATEFRVEPYTWPLTPITEPYWHEVHFPEHKLTEIAAKYPSVRSGATLNDLIPIRASTTDEKYSEDSMDCIFFIRIGDELMRVNEWRPASGTVRVVRGFNGSVAGSHNQSAIVTSPIYNKGCTPGSRKGKLAYCSDKGPENLPILERKGQEILGMMTAEEAAVRYDGTSLDAMTGGLPQFGMVNAHGLKAAPWDFTKNRPYSVYDWVTGHDRMIGIIQKVVHEETGRWPTLFANGVSPSHFERVGVTKRLVVPTDLKPRPLNGYNTEAGFSVGGKQFRNIFNMFRSSFISGYTPSWSFKAGHYADNQKNYDECLIYTFAFMYLVYEPKPKCWDVAVDGAGIVIGCSYVSPWFNMPSVGPEWIHPKSGRVYRCGLPYPLCAFGRPVKNQNFLRGVTGLGAGDIGFLEHLTVVPRHPAVGM